MHGRKKYEGLMEKKWLGEVGELMKKHFELRVAVGRVGDADKSTLQQFNRFLVKYYPKLKIPNRLSIMHFMKSKSHLSIGGKRNTIIYIRQFCLFLNQRGIKCYLPDKTLVPKYTYEPRFYSLKEEEVQNFMSIVRNNKYHKGLTSETYAIVIGLLWCTGMRSREVVKLNVKDVDLEKKIIFIRQTKFFKDRIVPINASIIQALKKYIDIKLAGGHPGGKSDPFFITKQGVRVPQRSLTHMFLRMTRKLKIIDANGKRPVLHDLRHNFATKSLYKFLSDPKKYPSQVWMPVLSAYMGHTNMFYTQYYLHPDFDLMVDASKKFEFSKEGKNEK